MDQAASGRVPVPEATVVFTVKVPARLAAAVREHARVSGRTISAVVAQAGHQHRQNVGQHPDAPQRPTRYEPVQVRTAPRYPRAAASHSSRPDVRGLWRLRCWRKG